MALLQSKAALTAPRKRLVEIMQFLGFGRIENLVVRDGDPVLDPLPRLVREIKCGGENGPRPERGGADFLLKAQLVDLFKHLDEMREGIIETLEVKHGLPFRLTVPCLAA
jgi:hypothetical protein